MAPLRTGAARIALLAEDRAAWGVGLQIQPVGLTYERKTLFRGRAVAAFGPPIEVAGLRDVAFLGGELRPYVPGMGFPENANDSGSFLASEGGESSYGLVYPERQESVLNVVELQGLFLIVKDFCFGTAYLGIILFKQGCYGLNITCCIAIEIGFVCL